MREMANNQVRTEDPFQELLNDLVQARSSAAGIIGAYLNAENAEKCANWSQRIQSLSEEVKEFICERDGLVNDLYHPSNRHLHGK